MEQLTQCRIDKEIAYAFSEDYRGRITIDVVIHAVLSTLKVPKLDMTIATVAENIAAEEVKKLENTFEEDSSCILYHVTFSKYQRKYLREIDIWTD